MVSSRVKKLLILVFILAVILIALFAFRTKSAIAPVSSAEEILRSHYAQGKVLIDKANLTLNVYVAKSEEERTSGLSPFASLKENEGMAFVFENPGSYGFWMKDMKFAIDMIWLDENTNIVGIKENATPLSYPEVFKPQKVAKYVLEVNSGFVQKYNLKIGDKVTFLP